METLQRFEDLLRAKLTEARAEVFPAAAAPVAPATPSASAGFSGLAGPGDEPLPYGVSKVLSAMKRHDAERNKRKKARTTGR